MNLDDLKVAIASATGLGNWMVEIDLVLKVAISVASLHPTKSHVVVAKSGGQTKTIRFGQQGVKTNQTAGQREAFKSRHSKNIARGPMSAAYWANKVKWSPSKTKSSSSKWKKG